MVNNKKFLISYKLFFAFLGFSAIVTEIVATLERGVFNASNFFSFFTIEINILVCATFVLSALVLANGTKRRWLDILRSLTTVYILVVGIGFALLLSGLENVALTAVPWDNTVLHYIMPIAVLLDFIFDRPKSNINFKTGLLWISFPIIYVIYSLIRGVTVGWYPYPFLNPNLHGFGAVALTVLGLVVIGVLLIAGVTWLTKRKHTVTA